MPARCKKLLLVQWDMVTPVAAHPCLRVCHPWEYAAGPPQGAAGQGSRSKTLFPELSPCQYDHWPFQVSAFRVPWKTSEKAGDHSIPAARRTWNLLLSEVVEA